MTGGRPDPIAVDELLAAARRTLPERLSPIQAERALRDGALLIDIRGDEQRRRDGLIPGATVIPRNSLEWRCDPASAWRHPSIRDHQQRVILICNEGFQSSLAAANLQQLGLRRATDVIGGLSAWTSAGLPVAPWDESDEVASVSRPEALMTHWDSVYERTDLDHLSWHQTDPSVSYELITELGVDAHSAVIDVGGGRSPLAAALVRRGFGDVTVLDVSERALAAARDEMTPLHAIQFVHDDVLTWLPERRYALWHDRAVLHFFAGVEQRARYAATLRAAVTAGGAVVIGVFSPEGPEHCSGLPVMRYSAAQLAELLGPEFDLITDRREDHVTPAGVVQRFQWAAFRRRRDPA